ncbi:hypothetical protein C8R44DRAFT_853276 [Mycena epipterygia]|nr:hypothetical protein C8R44DRAFT_853276 [Mycena epipterygia]
MPSKKLARLEDAIKVADGLLKRAKSECARDHVDLLDAESRLLQAKLSASEIQSQMFEAGGVTLLFESNIMFDRSLWDSIAACCESLKNYLQGTRGIMRSISKCSKEIEKTHTSTLRIIQEERRRKLVQAIRDAQEVVAVLRSPTGYVHPVRHCGHSNVSNLFQEPYMPIADPKYFQPVPDLPSDDPLDEGKKHKRGPFDHLRRINEDGEEGEEDQGSHGILVACAKSAPYKVLELSDLPSTILRLRPKVFHYDSELVWTTAL